MFRFANIELLYLLSLIPLVMLLFWWAMRNRESRLARFGRMELMKILTPTFSIMSVRVKHLLYLIAVAMLIFAAARPQMGTKLREVKSRGVEMMLVVDVSNSMMAEDFTPNRLLQTKYAIERLFEGLKDQQRVGLIAFAGDASVELPITSDYRMARAFADRLSPSIVGVQGTDIGKAIDLASLSFSTQSEREKVVILITDGEGHDQGALNAAKRAKERGVRIFTIGIGTPEGAPISINGEFIKDENGDMVVTKLGEEMLQSIAHATDGAYVRATNHSIGLDEITKTITEMEQKELSTILFEEYGEYFQYFAALALIFMILESLIQEKKNRHLRRFDIFSD